MGWGWWEKGGLVMGWVGDMGCGRRDGMGTETSKFNYFHFRHLMKILLVIWTYDRSVFYLCSIIFHIIFTILVIFIAFRSFRIDHGWFFSVIHFEKHNWLEEISKKQLGKFAFFKHLLPFSGYFPIQEPSFSGAISFALEAMAEKEAAVQHRLAAKVWLRVIL